MLLIGNAPEKIFLLTGTAGAGKSSLREIFERIMGLKNVMNCTGLTAA